MIRKSTAIALSLQNMFQIILLYHQLLKYTLIEHIICIIKSFEDRTKDHSQKEKNEIRL